MPRRYWVVLLAVVALGWIFGSRGGAQLPSNAANGDGTGRFLFEVVESFDAKYEGDTPGHIGRHGGLGDRAPHVALGDAVFRGDGPQAQPVGVVTNLRWSRGQGSLEVEFDPTQKARIEVGEQVWIRLGGVKASQ